MVSLKFLIKLCKQNNQVSKSYSWMIRWVPYILINQTWELIELLVEKKALHIK